MARVHRRLARAAAIGAAGCVAAGPAAAIAGPAPAVAAASPARCVPAPPYRHCQRYSFTGNDQWFVVPGGLRSIRVLEWGAGGGGAMLGRPQYTAGAGGFTAGTVSVQPGEQFTVSVGQGGYAGGTGYDQNVYGGGGLGGNGAHTGASGGGMSALWADGYAIAPVLIAGGGGGASPGSQTSGSAGQYPAVVGGGGGGGLAGGTDGSRYSGQGASQQVAGDAGEPGADCGGSGIGGTAPTPGQQYYGGNGAGSDPAPAGAGAAAYGGGGGGGGYYGGGGGRCQIYSAGLPAGDGGGGSGYIAHAGVTRAFTLQGTDGNHAPASLGAPPAGTAVRSRFYRPGLGYGGGLSGAARGGNGQVVIEWGHATAIRGRPAPRRAPRLARRIVHRSPAGHALPLSGFPFLQAGVIGVLLIGLGGLVTWAGGRRRQS